MKPFALDSNLKNKQAKKEGIKYNSDTESESGSDSELDYDDNIINDINDKNNNINNIISKPKNNISPWATEIKKPKIHQFHISTEGIKYNTDEYKNHKKDLTLCDCCHSHFSKNMIADSEFGKMCQHCYFFINFTNPEPKYGWTLEKYIELCKDNHNTETCEKYKNSNSCHICICLHDLKLVGKNATFENTTKTKNITFSEPEKVHVFKNSNDDEYVYI
jgi:hypothetical protein